MVSMKQGRVFGVLAITSIAWLGFVAGCSDDSKPAPTKDGKVADKGLSDKGGDLVAATDGTASGDKSVTTDGKSTGDAKKTVDAKSTVDAAKGISFSTEVQAIFTASCASCHGSGSPSSGLDLSSGKAYAALVDVDSKECPGNKRVKPSDAASSYILKKLNGSGTCFTGNRMPPGGALDAAKIKTVTDWITQGAKNN